MTCVPLPGVLVEHDRAAMKLGQALDDRESEPSAAMARSLRTAFETVEHSVCWKSSGMPTPSSSTVKAIMVPSRRQSSCTRLRRRRKADGVGEEIIEDLGDAASVGHELVDARLDLDVELTSFCLSRSSTPCLAASIMSRTLHRRASFSFKRARVDGGEVENIVDDGAQRRRPRTGCRPHIRAACRPSGPKAGSAEHLGEAQHAVERRAQLVGHVGDEIALEPVRRLERLVLLDQGALGALGVGNVGIGRAACRRPARAARRRR